jgi:N-acyl-D-aspartate/D-glutamate deacylase
MSASRRTTFALLLFCNLKERCVTLDLKITGATIVDGSGRPPFSGDIGVKDGLIVQVGRVTGSAHRSINVAGALLTPGFIDPHTHYDGQAMWDEEVLPSSLHGVTTAFLGNCGVGFAPVAPGRHRDLITLMTGVEDVPASVLEAGLDWKWESFSDYLDKLSKRNWTIDIGTQITHDPVRIYVMGDRAMRREQARDDDIAKMRGIVSGALKAGAFGFSTGRNDQHRMADGRDTPASLAGVRELVGIAESLREHGHRVLQLTSDFDMNSGLAAFDDEFDLIKQMAKAARRPVCLNLVQRPGDNELWRVVMKRAGEVTDKDSRIVFQVAPRAVGVLMGLSSSFHPFVAHPSFQRVAHLAMRQRVEALRNPDLKAKILSEKASHDATKGNATPSFFASLLHDIDSCAARIFPDRGPRNYEPPYSDSLQAEARRRDVPAIEAAYDALLERTGDALLYWPIVNFGSGNLDYVREMLLHPNAIIGLGDAGAHLNNTTDYSNSTFALSFWPSKRVAGPGLPLEHVVRMMTGDQAAYFGLTDRGLIETGQRADFNLIDLARLSIKATRVAKDLPAGGQRLLQEAEGYLATFKGGTAVLENDHLTGARPGRLLRAS